MSANKETITSFPDGHKGAPIPLKPKSRYQTAKEGWGDRKSFQLSYGLGMDPDGIEEGSAILDAFREGEYVVDKDQQKREKAQQQECQRAYEQRQHQASVAKK